jgi:hypothetical protein
LPFVSLCGGEYFFLLPFVSLCGGETELESNFIFFQFALQGKITNVYQACLVWLLYAY